jgi:2-C-methyl-D-erythritol 4-phosphate cytidylyltransferase/2-C-methyl-D-erythritol 2,4-cyclodiphosphate synthase
MSQFTATAVIVAAGSGLRFGAAIPKQALPMAGLPVAGWSVRAFQRSGAAEEIVLVIPPGGCPPLESLAGPGVRLVEGGPRRSDSVRLGLAAARLKTDVALIHDGARPLVDPLDIVRVAEAAFREGAAILAVPVTDTLKRAGEGDRIVETVDRRSLWRAQTPQGFRRDVLEKALALDPEAEATDEAVLVERLGLAVKLVEGSPVNLKITAPGDLELAERLARGAGGELRVGQGFDFHAFASDRELWLGGVRIEGERGLAGHSDADVLSHALVDALLGAAALGDVGTLFPPDDERWLGAAGTLLLGLAVQRVREAGFEIVNADLTLIGERPRISEHRGPMIAAMARALGVDPLRLNLKGKTTEGLGFLGRGEGLGASAVATLKPVHPGGGPEGRIR